MHVYEILEREFSISTRIIMFGVWAYYSTCFSAVKIASNLSYKVIIKKK